jgi:hypothetical protein
VTAAAATGIPFVMTAKIKAALRQRGYSDADIEQLTPTDAHKIIGNGAEPAPDPVAEITIFKKRGGPLSKHIELVDGKVSNNSSHCAMGEGSAWRVRIALNHIATLAEIINKLGPREAYADGRLRDGLADKVRIVVASRLANFQGRPDVAARTKVDLVFAEGAAGIALIDVDHKGMRDDQRLRIRETGGVWKVLCAVLPALANTARVVRDSTSHGLRNRETGEDYPDSGGSHTAAAVADSADIPRFLADFSDRLWLAGWGWGMVSAAGSFLERSLVDKAVASPERLIFEAPPVIVPPLEQAPRLAVAYEGAILDTLTACPPLTAAEQAKAQKLKDAESLRLKPEREEKRAKWSEGHIKRIVATGIPEPEARAQVAGWLDRRELTGDFPLPFDDPKLAGTTVADVLAHPAKFIDKTLADPFEGPSYGRSKARIYRRENGSLFINSFAHGGIHYQLKAAPEPGGPTPSSTIELRVGDTEKIVNELERRLLACNRKLFQRAGAIVCTGFAEMPTWNKGKVITQIIATRGDYALIEDLEAVAGFLHFNKKGKLVPCSPPMRLVYTLKDREHRLRFPVLVGIVNCPSISVDGELLDQPGYDPRTGILFDPLGVTFPRVPDCPSRRQAEAALKRLERLIETFDFVTDDDKAVALSLFLTIIARRGLPFVPLHGFDAPVAGSGKSKIVDIASILATGHEAGVVSLGQNQEEAEKRLSSMLMRGDPLIAIDNLDQPLEGALLNQALTQQQVELRILGLSKMVVARTSALITATGNNLIVKGDMTRRGVVGRLDPKVERPELREFTYDPLADAKENRGELVVAALTILKAYHNAGRPNRPSPLQSFTHWSDTVRAALLWLGMGDPVKTMLRLRKTDPATSNLKAVLTVWRDQFGNEPTSSAAVVAKAEETITFEKAVGSDEKVRRHAHPSLREALLMVAGKSGRIDIRALGQWLGKSADRVIDIGDEGARDFVALEEGNVLHGARRWRVVQKQRGS